MEKPPSRQAPDLVPICMVSIEIPGDQSFALARLGEDVLDVFECALELLDGSSRRDVDRDYSVIPELHPACVGCGCQPFVGMLLLRI